jgi:hypothetical protein
MNTTAARRSAPPPPPAAVGPVWYALLAPPAAWAVQGGLGWYFGEQTCGGLSPGSVRGIVLAISIAALAIALVGMNRAWRSRGADDLLHGEHRDRAAFLAFGGFLVSTIFAIAIIWGGLSSAFLSDCGRMR